MPVRTDFDFFSGRTCPSHGRGAASAQAPPRPFNGNDPGCGHKYATVVLCRRFVHKLCVRVCACTSHKNKNLVHGAGAVQMGALIVVRFNDFIPNASRARAHVKVVYVDTRRCRPGIEDDDDACACACVCKRTSERCKVVSFHTEILQHFCDSVM